jgi:hypothetical protein
MFSPKRLTNRFSIVNSYKKEQSVELLSKLSLDQLLTIINFNNKETLLKIINNSMTKTDLQDILFKSAISDEDLLENLNQKFLRKIQVVTGQTKPEDITKITHG